jgi:Holliday junction DNA helicase RuvA
VIGFVRGKLVVKAPPHLTVDVGGVGYDIEAPMSTFYTLPALGSELRLLTHLVVREDAHILYGFGTEEERALFRNLLKVSGIGPTADRLLVEMRDRLDAVGTVAGAGAPSAAQSRTEGEAWSALVALGYKPTEVTQMLKPFSGSGDSTEDLIRRALQGAVRPQ